MEAEQLDDIQALEEKYGSLANVPEDNEKLMSLRKSFSGNYHDIPITKTLRRTMTENSFHRIKVAARNIGEQGRQEIISLLKDGYTSTEISTVFGYNTSAISGVRNFYHIEVRPHFMYELQKDGKPVLYSQTIGQVRDFTNYQPIRTHYTAYKYIKEELSEQGYVLTRGYYNWRCIPNKCLVNFSKGEDMFLMRKGDVKFDN
ncbi:hypothetical protein [Lactobacillus jensenii]|uniref:Helix-turn-helix domain-containing protein n=1 Tax=Lactobacillus jensenii TaxID=109790 RepID=A0A5N1IBG0_LACJE|nr:hypothetical protein [Lactobacillus jensenii]DAS59731.1 MAG TPA: hypothetical protein [Caudoviricetes sp.]EEX26681.1 hypothetical protein HMPREF0527_01520 [Lactobacillus jensenii SJ-7A-US]KAA9322965.1 hypothetical protein F6H94_04210 [Lactobacillus jensenii]MBS5831782.1 hypothetical protein [Lactobacillus jensenii]MCW8071615.1 hypothetical protein [Lactobacillus jensenii]